MKISLKHKRKSFSDFHELIRLQVQPKGSASSITYHLSNQLSSHPSSRGPFMSPCLSSTKRKLSKRWQADERKRRKRKQVTSQLSFQSAVLVIAARLVQAVSKAPRTRLLAHRLCSELLGTLYTTADFYPKCRAALAWPCIPSPSAKQHVQQQP